MNKESGLLAELKECRNDIEASIAVYCSVMPDQLKLLLRERLVSINAALALAKEQEPAEERFPLCDWQYEVGNGDTKLGYKEWVAHKTEAEQSCTCTCAQCENLRQGDDTTIHHCGSGDCRGAIVLKDTEARIVSIEDIDNSDLITVSLEWGGDFRAIGEFDLDKLGKVVDYGQESDRKGYALVWLCPMEVGQTIPLKS